MLCNNLMLSNWLNSVKNNNVNLYDNMAGNNIAESLLGQSSDRFGGINNNANNVNNNANNNANNANNNANNANNTNTNANTNTNKNINTTNNNLTNNKNINESGQQSQKLLST